MHYAKDRILENYPWLCTKLIEWGGRVQKLFNLTDPEHTLSLLLKLLQFIDTPPLISILYIDFKCNTHPDQI